VQYHLANKNVDAAIAECDRQKGSVGNVMKAGLRKYKEMISNSELGTEQKVLAIQKEVEEATSLELPMLEKNLVFLSTIASERNETSEATKEENKKEKEVEGSQQGAR